MVLNHKQVEFILGRQGRLNVPCICTGREIIIEKIHLMYNLIEKLQKDDLRSPAYHQAR